MPPHRTAPRAHSILSSSSFAIIPRATPHPTPPPPSTRQYTTRALRAPSLAATLSETQATPVKSQGLPDAYFLAPTVPNPFTGSLDASLDAILAFSTLYTGIQPVVDTLLRPVVSSTNWPMLLGETWVRTNTPEGRGRYIIEEVLFLVARTLLPEQVAENRALLGDLYEGRKHTAMRLLGRYDLLRGWKEGVVGVASVPPASALPDDKDVGLPSTQEERKNARQPYRRPFMPNVIPTLIAAPAQGYSTHGVRERMKHHVTSLDTYLLFTDAEVEKWSDTKVLTTTSQVVLTWQWLRRNNEILEDMEVRGWEDLEGKAEENGWFGDDPRKTYAKGEKGE